MAPISAMICAIWASDLLVGPQLMVRSGLPPDTLSRMPSYVSWNEGERIVKEEERGQRREGGEPPVLRRKTNRTARLRC